MVMGRRSRKQPWNVHSGHEDWTNQLVIAQHTEALWMVGEPALFTLMWRITDFNAGRVDRCSICSSGRSAKAFKQASDSKCPGCFGTTFEGGIRAQVIRPAIFADRNSERADTVRGTMDIDSLQIETTEDFTFHVGDFIFRRDGYRYQGQEKGEGVLRTGFASPLTSDSFRGTIPQAQLEDPTAVAYLIPPTSPVALATMLSQPPYAMDLIGIPYVDDGPLPPRQED